MTLTKGRNLGSDLLTLEKELHDLRHDRRGTLVELRRRQVRDRVRHREELEVRKTPGSSHGLAGDFENVRNDRGGRHAVLFKYYAVEHTARAA